MTIKNSIIIFCFIGISFFQIPKATAQSSSGLDQMIDSLFTELEEDYLLLLIDSLLKTKEPLKSEMMIRFSYLSKVSSMGRDMGIDLSGVAPSLGYFHKSGLYADVSRYWNNGDSLDMRYTMLMLGYMKDLGKVYGINLSYDRSFYDEDGYKLTNTFGISNYFNFDFLDMGIDYNLLFGKQTAHRLNINIGGYFPIRKVLFFDRIIFSPGMAVMIGTSNVVNEHYTMEQVDNYSPFVGGPPMGAGRQLRPSFADYYNASEGSPFGVMNYNFFMPVRFRIKNFILSVRYNYNIPVTLPGENISLPPYSYFSLATAYRFRF
jgi:hypothetical protein